MPWPLQSEGVKSNPFSIPGTVFDEHRRLEWKNSIMLDNRLPAIHWTRIPVGHRMRLDVYGIPKITGAINETGRPGVARIRRVS
jgi:hypothetical protein